MPSLFTRIVKGEIPAEKIFEDEHYLAFLDIRPLAKGHTLVIPKKEVDYLFDLEDEILSGLFITCRKVAQAIEKAIECKRVGVAVIGLEVPHAHVHLVPLNNVHDLDFSRPKLILDSQELSVIAEKIRGYIVR